MTDKETLQEAMDVSIRGFNRAEELKTLLKRKEQECEKLKNERTVNLVKQLDQLKAENKHLSEKEEEAKHYLGEAEKFKNCLAEIKESTMSVM